MLNYNQITLSPNPSVTEQNIIIVFLLFDLFILCRLTQAEIAFLDEFCCVMRPVARALNVLQSETNTHLGWLLPVIVELQSKLRRLGASVKICHPLISALQKGVEKRFGVMLEDRELIAAAILLPKFKTGWTDKAQVIEEGMSLVLFICFLLAYTVLCGCCSCRFYGIILLTKKTLKNVILCLLGSSLFNVYSCLVI